MDSLVEILTERQAKALWWITICLRLSRSLECSEPDTLYSCHGNVRNFPTPAFDYECVHFIFVRHLAFLFNEEKCLKNIRGHLLEIPLAVAKMEQRQMAVQVHGTQRQLWIFSAMARRKMEELNRRGVREYRTRVWFNYNYVRYVFVIALVHFPLPFPYNLIFSFLCVSVMRTIMCIYHLAWTGHRQWSMPFISGRLRASASGIIFSCTGVGRNLLVLTCQITRIAFCRGCSNCSLLTSITRIDVSVSLWCIACMHWILLTTYSLCSQPIHWY